MFSLASRSLAKSMELFVLKYFTSDVTLFLFFFVAFRWHPSLSQLSSQGQ